MPHCSYGTCNSDSRRGLPGFSSEVKFYRFPQPCLLLRNNILNWSKNEENVHVKRCKKCSICRNWMIRCKRNDHKFQMVRQISNNLYVCSKHFQDQPAVMDYEKYLPSAKQPNVSNARRKRRNETITVLHEGESLSINEQIISVDSETDTGDDDFPLEPVFCCTVTPTDGPTPLPVGSASFSVSEGTLTSVETSDASTQTTWVMPEVSVLIENLYKKGNEIQELDLRIKDLEKQLREVSTITNFEKQLYKSDVMCKFYTGFNVAKVNAIISFASANNIRYWGNDTSKDDGDTIFPITTHRRERRLTQNQELLLMFLRLRGGLLVEDISYRFSLSISFISRVTTTWIQALYQKFDSVRRYMLPSRDVIKETLPLRFKNFKNIRIIIDCAEIRCESPSSFEHQGNCYSEYKSNTTFKLLIGCTPTGSVCFVSDVMEGSISDREIVSQSGLIDLLEEGDLVLADRGFTVRDLTDKKGAVLKIPAFMRGRDSLTAQEEIATKEIAANRIFVEHVVGRLKQFRLFQRVVPLSMRAILSQAVFVCACLLNFHEPIVQ